MRGVVRRSEYMVALTVARPRGFKVQAIVVSSAKRDQEIRSGRGRYFEVVGRSRVGRKTVKNTIAVHITIEEIVKAPTLSCM